MKSKKKSVRISVRSLLVKDMILSRKGGPHNTPQYDDWWDEAEELHSWCDDEEEG
jgi:hypothetical protein